MRSAKRSFMELPPELRNQIYLCYIDATTSHREIDWSSLSPHEEDRRITDTLALSRLCKQIRKEYLSLWISTVTVRVREFHLERYLVKFHSLDNTVCSHANLCLLLPQYFNGSWIRSRAVTDITSLFKAMVQNKNLNCKMATVWPPGGAVDDMKELDDILSKVSHNAIPVLDSIVSVQLSVSQHRPIVHFTLKEHRTLPGEWPWYGAYDLNRESLLLWVKWFEGLGLLEAGLKVWCIDITAEPHDDNIASFTPIFVDDQYTKPRQGGTLRLFQ
ncbi:hypothetical protein C7974DRAFT_456628 [Boeremia exigua]|uniref:uncharacterized protein n=1 Tax=Boeremia exigua TaxID=749465 RepID=UPI001E8EC038|nr:uncharacterized protein C7974DRAFT_456628 [Boeremia exigua]KAH6621872.1 hypothetical protein C7974DRAFT_456628 [Boeremia exigua]